MGIYLDNMKGTKGLRCKKLNLGDFKKTSSKLSEKILQLLIEESAYPKEIAKKLGEEEQKIYYHIHNLEKAGFIIEDRREDVRGASAKFYKVSSPSFSVLLKEPETLAGKASSKERKEFLSPFIEDGELNSLVVVGSPDPHGPEMARSRDGHYAVDLALFLGSFLSQVPELKTKLDTEFKKDDWNNNLILIGGPIVNNLSAKIHNKKELPIYFETSKIVCSTISKKCYEEGRIGIIEKMDNPFCKGKKILLIAGNSYRGTRAAVIALTKNFDELIKGNNYNKKKQAKIVAGKDLDADGIVDTAEILE